MINVHDELVKLWTEVIDRDHLAESILLCPAAYDILRGQEASRLDGSLSYGERGRLMWRNLPISVEYGESADFNPSVSKIYELPEVTTITVTYRRFDKFLRTYYLDWEETES